MRAVRVVRHGRPTEVIEVQDIPVPDVEPGGVRVAVSAAAVNFGDIARCRGGVASVMAQPPFTLGMDVCGVVDAAGAGAEHWIGRRVVARLRSSPRSIRRGRDLPDVPVVHRLHRRRHPGCSSVSRITRHRTTRWRDAVSPAARSCSRTVEDARVDYFAFSLLRFSSTRSNTSASVSSSASETRSKK